MKDLAWWQNLKQGEEYLFSYLFIDRVGSTKDSENHTRDEVAERAAVFHQVVEDKVASFNGICLEWHGDGTVAFFFTEKPDSLVERSRILSKKAVDCALSITSELVVRDEIKAYLAIHTGLAPFQKKLGKIKAPELDVGGHMQASSPEAGILIHQEVFQALPSLQQKQFRYLGTTQRDGATVFVYPRQREIGEKNRKDFLSQESDHYQPKKKYLDYLGERYGKLVPRGLRQERLVSVDLFHIFAPLKVRRKETMGGALADSLMDSPELGAETFPPGQPSGELSRSLLRTQRTFPPISILELLSKNRHAVILGPPGSGKSTLLSWLALSCAKGKISAGERLGLAEDLFPVPVSVGHLAHIWATHQQNIGLLEAVIEYFKVLGSDISSFIHEEIKKERAFFLLDGMDEIQQDLDGREVARWIESFLQANSSCRCVVTSRIIGFPGLSIPGGNEYTMEELTLQEAKPLVEKWMVALAQAEREQNETAERMGREEAEKLTKLLEATPQLAPFIANPFLLTLTVLVHKLEARLPNYRIQLFERMIQTLVETWHQARGLSIIQPEGQRMDFRAEAIPIFAPLALWMHKKYPSGTVPEKELIDFIRNKLKEQDIYPEDAQKGIKEFLQKVKDQAGLLEEKGPGVWGFTHLAFEEYLCAVELVREDLYNEYLDKYRYHSRWEEVLVLVASELGITQASSKKVSRYIEKIWKGTGDEGQEEMLKKHVLLAGRCVINSANVKKKLSDEINSQLIEFLLCGNGSLSKRVATIVKEMLHCQGVGGKIKETVLLELKDKKNITRTLFISIIINLGIEEDWGLEIIKTGLNDSLTRAYSLQAICSLGINNGWAIKSIKEGLKNKSKWVRYEVFYAIMHLRKKNHWAIEAIKAGVRDEENLVRSLAINNIGFLGILEDWTIDIITKGIADQNPSVHASSLDALSYLGITDAWAIKAIKKGIKSDNFSVRTSAIYAISALGIKKDWAIKAIRKGTFDNNVFVRISAITAIGNLEINSNWSLKAIKEGVQDEDFLVRSTAISIVSFLRIREPWAMEAILKEMKDPDSRVKRAAYEALWALTAVTSNEETVTSNE